MLRCHIEHFAIDFDVVVIVFHRIIAMTSRRTLLLRHFDFFQFSLSFLSCFISSPLHLHFILWNTLVFVLCASINVYIYAIRVSFVPINLVCLRSISCFRSVFFHSSVSFFVFAPTHCLVDWVVRRCRHCHQFSHSLDCTLPFIFSIRARGFF